jgi:hypothetical protein
MRAQFLKPVLVLGHSIAHLFHVVRAIIDGGNARNCAGDMVYQTLDDVRRNAEPREVRCKRSSSIAK